MASSFIKQVFLHDKDGGFGFRFLLPAILSVGTGPARELCCKEVRGQLPQEVCRGCKGRSPNNTRRARSYKFQLPLREWRNILRMMSVLSRLIFGAIQFMDYQAKLPVPFGVLGIRCTEDALTGIDFLPATEKPQHAISAFAKTVCEQLLRYFENPDVQFTVPFKLNGTPHQQKVWQALIAIPRGETRSYGELAAALRSGAQAVGQACGANPIPIIIPCHRVASKSGLGGFMRHASGNSLDIKRWLLAHEDTALAPSPYGGGLGRGK
jgi:methylated-DNA-[protein]-cysteine S-methyltransferase